MAWTVWARKSLLLAAFGCGYDDDTTSYFEEPLEVDEGQIVHPDPGDDRTDQTTDPTADRTRQLLLGTQTQIDMGQRIAGSYVVAFRAPEQTLSLTYANFFLEARSHIEAQFSVFATESAVRRMHFLTGLDLGSPSRYAQAGMRLTKEGQGVFGDKSLDSNKATNKATGNDPDQATHVPGLTTGLNPQSAPASLMRVDFHSEQEAQRTLKTWFKDRRIWYAEPNFLNELKQPSTLDFTNAVVPAYQASGATWWQNDLKLAQAFARLGSLSYDKKPVVAILDSGTDINHPAFANDRIWQNPTPGLAGCGTDIYGCDTTKVQAGRLGTAEIQPYSTEGFGQSCTPNEPGLSPSQISDIQKNCYHGTHVAGLVAAAPIEGQAVGGTCPICQILTVKVVEAQDKAGLPTSPLRGSGKIPDSAILAGLKYTSFFRNDVRVVNSSYGKFQRSTSVNLITRILANLPGGGILVVGAAGNEDTLRRSYPAAFEEPLSVGSLDDNLTKSSFSNFGSWIDVSAPGGFGEPCTNAENSGNIDGSLSTSVKSTSPGGNYVCLSGTSMAAPMVSGIAAMLTAITPGLSSSDIKRRLILTSDPTIYNIENSANNAIYYRRRVSTGETVSLLGSGAVDADAAFGNVPSGAVPAGLLNQRVKSGCAIIQLDSSSTSNPQSRTPTPWQKGFWLLLLLTPALLLALARAPHAIFASLIFGLLFGACGRSDDQDPPPPPQTGNPDQNSGSGATTNSLPEALSAWDGKSDFSDNPFELRTLPHQGAIDAAP